MKKCLLGTTWTVMLITGSNLHECVTRRKGFKSEINICIIFFQTAKPLMEKKRRARINASLTELKNLLVDVLKQEGIRSNKMEKADILETTVKYLRQIQRSTTNTTGN